MQGEFGKKTYSMCNKVYSVTHTLIFFLKIIPNYNLVWSFIYYFILYFQAFSCKPNPRRNLQKLKMNCGLIFTLNDLSELKATLVRLKDYGYLKMERV